MKKLSGFLLVLCCFQANADMVPVNKALNDFHKAAAEANGEIYFDLLADDATYIGTDITETWSKEQFKSYAKPFFSKGRGWSYQTSDRNVYFNSDKTVAWFDELLINKSYGNTRGTGVLELTDNGWKIKQYHLTIPVPNEITEQVVEQIRQTENQQITGLVN